MKITFPATPLVFFMLQTISILCHGQGGISNVYEYPTTIYKVSDGLSQSQVQCVYQDRYGFIWVGTKEGINRFDGLHFEHFKNNPIYPDDFINDITGIGTKDIWFTGRNGVYHYNGSSFKNLLPDSLVGKIIPSRIAVTKKGIIYFKARDKNNSSLYTIINKEIINLRYAYKELQGKFIGRLTATEENNLFFTTVNSTTKEVELWSLQNDTLNAIPTKIKSQTLNIEIFQEAKRTFFYINNIIYTLEKDTLKFYAEILMPHRDFKMQGFIIRGEEIIVYNRNEIFKQLNDKVEYYGFQLYQCSEAIMDTQGKLWICTEEGLIKVRSEAFINYPQSRGMPKAVWSIIEDDEKNMWFATYANGLYTLVGNKYNYIDTESYVPNDWFYMGGIKRKNGDILFPTNNNVLKFNKSKKPIILPNSQGSAILSIYEDGINDMLYMGTNGLRMIDKNGSVRFYNDSHGLDISIYKFITDLEKDSAGILWLGSHRGLATFDGNEFNNFYAGKELENGVVTMFKDYKENMWFGTSGKLLHHNYTTKIPFPIDKGIDIRGRINFITAIDSSYLVLGLVNSLLLLDLQKFYTNEFVYFTLDKADGFDGVDCGQNGFCHTMDGHLWITSSEMVVEIIPEKLNFQNENVPLYISSIGCKQEELGNYHYTNFSINDSLLNFETDSQDIEIIFYSVDQSNNSKTSYETYLEGYNEQWSSRIYPPPPSSNSPSFPSKRYSNLNVGNYTFHVKSFIGQDTIGSNKIKINIKPTHIFQIRWVQIISFVISIGLSGLGIILWLKEKQRKKEAKMIEENEKLKLQYNSIINQIHPHFTFNIISAICDLIETNKSEQAEKYLLYFAEILRAVLYDDNKLTRTLEQEIAFVRKYINLEKLRFPSKFIYEIKVDDNVNLKSYIPKMIIQTFANNAIKHGLKPLEKGGELIISISQISDTINIEIQDNGIGFMETKKRTDKVDGGKGLIIITKMLNWFENKYSFKNYYVIEDLTSHISQMKGTKVSIHLYTKYQND